jgi:predicted LPLAT superfamily acyltransferase
VSAHWSERREGGGRFALWLIRSIGLTCGRAAARVLLPPIAWYFFLRRGPERRASRAFLTRLFGRPARATEVLRHIHCYAATILDRVFLLAESVRRFELVVHGLDALEAELARGRGALLLGAHIGSFEVLRALADRRPELRVRWLMDRAQTPALTRALLALNPAAAAAVIDVGAEATDIALALHTAAAQGALIGLLADRTRRGEAVAPVDFLGAPAPFPLAPYRIAAALQVPVVLGFGLYRGGNRYEVYFERFAESIQIPRTARAAVLRAFAQRYADRLAHYTRLDPYNWFNFYDFWQSPDPVRRTDGGAAA